MPDLPLSRTARTTLYRVRRLSKSLLASVLDRQDDRHPSSTLQDVPVHPVALARLTRVHKTPTEPCSVRSKRIILDFPYPSSNLPLQDAHQRVVPRCRHADRQDARPHRRAQVRPLSLHVLEYPNRLCLALQSSPIPKSPVPRLRRLQRNLPSPSFLSRRPPEHIILKSWGSAGHGPREPVRGPDRFAGLRLRYALRLPRIRRRRSHPLSVTTLH